MHLMQYNKIQIIGRNSGEVLSLHDRAINTYSEVLGLWCFYVRKLIEDVTPLSKHVEAILLMNYVLRFVFYIILFSVFVVQ